MVIPYDKQIAISKGETTVELTYEESKMLSNILIRQIQEWDGTENGRAAPTEETRERRRKIIRDMASNFGRVEPRFCLRCV